VDDSAFSLLPFVWPPDSFARSEPSF
jgi:hypothetical protein